MESLANKVRLSSRSCDRCHGRKKSCSMHMPQCLLCQASGSTCTYLRPIKRNRVTPLSKFKALEQANQSAFLPVKGYTLPQAIIADDFPKTIQVVLAKSHLLEVLLGLVNVPLYESNFQARKMVVSLINTLEDFKIYPGDKSKRNQPSKNLIKKTNTAYFGSIDLRKSALLAYFKYINPFSPLFTWRSFHSKPRTRFLNLAIFLSGLRLLKRSQTDYPWFTKVCKELVELANENLTKISLDNLQAFLIIRLTLYSNPLLKSIARYGIFILERMVHSLGLHQTPPNSRLGPYSLLERKLTYNTVFFLLDYDACVVRKHIYTSHSPCFLPSKLDYHNYSKPKAKPTSLSFIMNQPSTPKIHNVYDECLLLISCSFANQIVLFRGLIKLRHLIKSRTSVVATVNAYLNQLVYDCENSWKLDQKKINRSKLSQIFSPPEDELWDKTLSFLNLMYQQTHFFLIELYSHLNDLQGQDRPTLNPVKFTPSQLSLLTRSSMSIIQFGSEFGSQPYFPERVFIFLTAFQFLAFHTPEHKLIEEVKERCYFQFCSLLQYPFLAGSIRFHMEIFERVFKQIEMSD